MSALTSFLNPSLVDVWRRVPDDTVNPTGGYTYTPTKLYSQLPAFVDHATRGVSDKLEFAGPTGEMIEQTDICFIDGLVPQQFAGSDPGDMVTVNGIDYIVNADGRGAFPDVKPFDVVVRGTDRYIVLQATKYDEVEPSLQLHLNFGKAWETPPSPTPPPEGSTVHFKAANFPGAGILTADNGGDMSVTSSTITLANDSTVEGTFNATGSSFNASGLTIDEGATLTLDGASVFVEGGIAFHSGTVEIDDAAVFSDAAGLLGYFSAAPTGLEVAFTDASYSDGSNGDVVSWAWDFGDSSGTSALQNPSYTYETGGTYEVQLVASTGNGSTTTVTVSVTVS